MVRIPYPSVVSANVTPIVTEKFHLSTVLPLIIQYCQPYPIPTEFHIEQIHHSYVTGIWTGFNPTLSGLQELFAE